MTAPLSVTFATSSCVVPDHELALVIAVAITLSEGLIARHPF